MYYFSRILIVAVTVLILTLSLALAGSKFKNEDTAKNRQDNAFGTDATEETSTTTFDTNETGDSVLKMKPRPAKPEVDWYDKIIITADPNTSWP